MNLLYLLGVLVLGAVLLAGKSALAYIGGKPAEVQLADIGGGFLMRTDAAAMLVKMKDAARRDGVLLQVNSAFRTMEQQQYLYQLAQSGNGSQAATPGYSNHQSGIAVDIRVYDSFDSAEYRWLDQNAGDYGFENTGKYFTHPEPWHWEYTASGFSGGVA